MPGVSNSIEINAPPEEVYRVIIDFESYTEFLPEVERICVHTLSETQWRVDYQVRVIKKIQYTLASSGTPGKELTWELISGGGPMKSNKGAWTLEPLEGGRTKAIYSLEVTFGRLVPKSLQNTLAAASLPSMLGRFKKRIESQTA